MTGRFDGVLEIGSNVFINNDAHIVCFEHVKIGNDVRLGERVSIHDENHRIEPVSDLIQSRDKYDTKAIEIGENVWLGCNVVVLAGVTIGANSVIAAGSVVTRPIPPGVLAGGAPAKVLRKLAP